jgi:hypothetical protein
MQCGTAVIPGFSNRGIEAGGLAEALQSFGRPVQHLQNNSIIVERNIGRRVVLQGPTKIGLGLGKAAKLSEHHAH